MGSRHWLGFLFYGEMVAAKEIALFNWEGWIFCFSSIGAGEFIIYVYCRLLSQAITHTDVVMQKGNIPNEVITLNIKITK
jgi:hypothetical protein